MEWGKIYSTAGWNDIRFYVWCDEEKGPDDGEEAVEVCGYGKSGPGSAGRRPGGLHIPTRQDAAAAAVVVVVCLLA